MAKKKTAKKKAAKKVASKGKTQISISLPANLVAQIDKLADADNRNRSNFIAKVLQELAEE